jgi:metal-responsive CopG/Arc/MetJ family transcriptional regulator
MEDAINAKPQPLVTVQVRLPPDLLQRIDDYRQKLTIRPTRSQVVRFLLENAVSILEAGETNAPEH